jgi:hypothetical protein
LVIEQVQAKCSAFCCFLAVVVQKLKFLNNSIIFLRLVFFGYFCGISGKIFTRNITYVFVFYVINFVMVGIDIVFHFRNRKLDRVRETAPG